MPLLPTGCLGTAETLNPAHVIPKSQEAVMKDKRRLNAAYRQLEEAGIP